MKLNGLLIGHIIQKIIKTIHILALLFKLGDIVLIMRILFEINLIMTQITFSKKPKRSAKWQTKATHWRSATISIQKTSMETNSYHQ